MGQDTHHPIATGGHDGECLVVIAAPHVEAILRSLDYAGDLVQVAAGFFDAHDISNLAEAKGSLVGHVQTGAAGDVIEDARQIGGLGDCLEVLVKAFLRGLVVGGHRQQQRVYADTFGLSRQLAGLAVVIVRFAGDDGGRFALVLEDLAPAEQGDQIKGCGVDHARSAVINLAGLHAPRWCDPTLLDLGWTERISQEQADGLQAMLVIFAEQFVEHYGSQILPRDASILRSFIPKSASWMRGRQERFSPVHGDYRLDNLLFATPAGGSPVATVDWQTLEIGLPGRDLAYFLGNSLTSKDRRESERELVGAYHEALMALGVTGHSLDECFDDYRYGQFHGLIITVVASVILTHAGRGEEMFMEMFSRACEAIGDLESLELP